MTDAPRPSVAQLRVVVEAADFDEAVAFYRDALGLPESVAYAEGGDDRVSILEVGRATLEIASPGHRREINRIEAGGRESPRIRLAFEVTDATGATRRLEAAGATVVAEPVETPWRSLNARLEAPADLTITLFEELADSHERAGIAGFSTDVDRSAPDRPAPDQPAAST
ncbi:VOC family protein [Agromyces sp. CFH 90414]|uniref:VOC family protein n=1 Tax=Agromyces agglutinans TaxID=2662258 RepID=A0A6I2FA55_9MICO|nr:VOC family protein [Agromyces agglutinans]MRG61782.1 VOC family protein [Agromyces agglutinans]